MDSNLPTNSGASLVTRPSSLRVACVLLAACAISSGCATAINGTTQRVAVASNPPGAQVYLRDAPVGVTPAFVDVPRRDPDLQLRLEKEGYEPTVVPLQRSLVERVVVGQRAVRQRSGQRVHAGNVVRRHGGLRRLGLATGR